MYHKILPAVTDSECPYAQDTLPTEEEVNASRRALNFMHIPHAIHFLHRNWLTACRVCHPPPGETLRISEPVDMSPTNLVNAGVWNIIIHRFRCLRSSRPSNFDASRHPVQCACRFVLRTFQVAEKRFL